MNTQYNNSNNNNDSDNNNDNNNNNIWFSKVFFTTPMSYLDATPTYRT